MPCLVRIDLSCGATLILNTRALHDNFGEDSVAKGMHSDYVYVIQKLVEAERYSTAGG